MSTPTTATETGLDRIARCYDEDVMKFASTTKACWLASIRDDLQHGLTLRGNNRDAWLIHVAAMIARMVEL